MANIFLASTIKNVAHLIPKFSNSPILNSKLLFVTTASEPEVGDKTWLLEEKKALEKIGFLTQEYTLTNKTADEVKHELQKVDAVFISGGNPFYLLYKMQQCNFEPIIKVFIKDHVYIGASSGAIVAAPNIEAAHREDALKEAPKLDDFKGLGLVDFVTFPHWGSDMTKNLYLEHRMKVAYNQKNKIILLTDNQLIVVKEGWYQIVQS